MSNYELPLYMDANTIPARLDRLFIERAFQGRNRVFYGLVATQRAAGANFSIDVTAGALVMAGSSETDQGMYLGKTKAVINVTVPATPGANRTDKLIAYFRDPNAGGVAGSDLILQVIAGNVATPANAMLLYNVMRILPESAIVTPNLVDVAPRGVGPVTVATVAPSGLGVAGDIVVVV